MGTGGSDTVTRLAQLPPGPQLAAALATVDPSTLNGHDLVELAAAQLRMISHLQAGLATVLDQVQHCPAGGPDSAPVRTEQVNRWAEIDIAAKLRWSAGKAGYELRYAHQLIRRVPAVHAALSAGVIDWPRARTMIDAVRVLDDDAAHQITAQVLANGGDGWNPRRLSATLRRAVIAHDPQAAVKRLRERLGDRWVETDTDPEGTANLHAMHLPPQRLAEIMERVTAIARSAKLRGDPRSLHQLRADTVCDLLAGTGVAAHPPAPITNPDPAPAGETATAGAAEKTPPPVSLPGPRRGVIELTVPLSALIGLSQAPGDLAGYGPVIADICRQITLSHTDAQWRYSIYDDLTASGDHHGQLAYHGITRARPDPAATATATAAAAAAPTNGFGAADTAFLRARDRTCRAPHDCHTSATTCDLDHTTAKSDGGGHHRRNGGPLCRRDHMFKHQSGATVHQPAPGVFEWITPLGHRYTVRPDPYDETTGPPPTPPQPPPRVLAA